MSKPNKTKNKNAGFYANDLISDSSEKGDKEKRKQDGSGKGTRENKGRGGCSPEEQKEAPTKTKKDNPFFYEYSEDFVDDANTFTKDKKRTKKDILGAITQASRILLTGKRNSPEWLRAKEVYEELQKYVIGDFTDDGRRMNASLLAELVESFDSWGQSEDPAVNRRVERMYNELKDYLLKQLNKKGKKDFTDDGSAYNYNLLRELADSWKIFNTERDPQKSQRAHKLFREIFKHLESKLNELDKLKRK